MNLLPKDGTVHEVTSNVLMFLEQLLEYSDTIGRVLYEDANYNSQLDKLKGADQSKALLGLYISAIIYFSRKKNDNFLHYYYYRKSIGSVKSHFNQQKRNVQRYRFKINFSIKQRQLCIEIAAKKQFT